MAAVYLCRDEQGQAVAVKWMDMHLPGAGPDDETLTPPMLARFEREVRSLTRVDHPGVVRYRGHGVWSGRPYLVMDHVEGVDLRSYAEKLQQRPPAERYARTRTIGQALCEAIGALHSIGLVHRDVKPANALVDPDGRVVLTDLGVVKDLFEADRTQAGLVVGTIAYAAPEQLDGGDVDARTDLYGVGATLYVLLTGHRPFGDGRRLPGQSVPPPSRWDPEIPADLEAVVLRLMAPRPDDRFTDAAEAARALAEPLGTAAGLPLAGRGRVVAELTEVLDRLEVEGGSLVLVLRGPRGVGRRWLAGVVRAAAARRGLLVVEPGDGTAAQVAVARAAVEPGVVVLSHGSVEVPAGLACHELELSPLGVADVRRTVVAAAPLTMDAARVAERLHRWTGGLPALLLPLIERCTRGARLDLPLEPPAVAAVDTFLSGLDLDALEVLGALAVTQGPADVERLQRLARLPPEPALEELLRRGIAREVDGRWSLTAELFRAAGIAAQVDPESLIRRGLAQGPEVVPVPGEGPDPEALALAGELADALLVAHRQAAEAQARGDRVAEGHALCSLGQVQLDLGLVDSARRTLANASALAKASGDAAVRARSHVLRARASLDGPEGGRAGLRAAAAAALDRVVPLAAGADQRQDGGDAFILALWARAAAALGDQRASRQAADRAVLRLPLLPDGEHGRCCMTLARAAVARGDAAGLEQALARLRPAEQGLPLLAWEAARARAWLLGQPLPPAGELGRGLAPPELAALEARPT